MNLIQTEQSKNRIKKLAQARLNKVQFTSIKENNLNDKVQFTNIKKNVIQLNYFKKGKAPYVNESIDIDKVFEIIKTGNGNAELINQARNFGKYTPEYDNIKMNLLPTVRFNFTFHTKVSDKNIKAATGLIYLDVDDVDSIDNTNQYIFASWKSLSSTGYGLLVKIDGLSLDNFETNYLEISSTLGIKSDIGAKKATQQTILSYDDNIYINNDSLVFKAKEKVVFSKEKSEAKKKEEKHILVNCTFEDYTGATRFNNFSEYFEDETPFIVFNEEKERMIIPFIPKSVEGNRTNNMFAYLSQIAILNTNANFNFLKSVANTFNKYCYPNLNDDKVDAIVNNVIKKKISNELLQNKNVERRLIFNPKVKMTKEEKQKIVAVEVGKIRTENTKKEIYNIIEDWDFEKNGLITQTKVSEISSKSIRTIKTHWNEFKDYIKELNIDQKSNVLSIENKEVIVDVVEDADNTPNWTIAPEYTYDEEIERTAYKPKDFEINEVDKLEIPNWYITPDYVKPEWLN